MQAPNVDQLKRDADHELARIARLLGGRWQPKPAALCRRGRAKVIAAGSEEVAMTDADVARRAAQAKWWCAE